MNEHTSQGLSQRLHDKGFRGPYSYTWCDHTEFGEGWILTPSGESDGMPFIYAHTFSELWGVLPDYTEADGKLEIHKRLGVWDESPHAIAGYMSYGREVTWRASFKHESPAEAVGLLLEWLIDEGHYPTEKPFGHEEAYHGLTGD